MKYTGLILLVLLIAFSGISCGKEAKNLKEELRVVKEENSFLKAENIALKKEIEELYKRLEEKEKPKAPAHQVQPAPAKTDSPKKDIQPSAPGKPVIKPGEKVKKPESERPR